MKMTINTTEREQQILDTAADLIIRHGYDKTTMGDIADALGLSRGLVYIHFKSKELLLEALIAREMLQYGSLWIQHIEADPTGGSIGSVYRGIMKALQQTPFLAAIVTQNEGVFGKYLRKPQNVFTNLQTPNMTQVLLQGMQEAGVIRPDVDLQTMAYIMDVISAGMVDSDRLAAQPDLAYDTLLETLADMLDRMLTPEDGGNLEAGRDLIRHFAAAAQHQLTQYKTSDQVAPE